MHNKKLIFLAGTAAVAAAVILLTSVSAATMAQPSENIYPYLEALGFSGVKISPVDSCTWRVRDASSKNIGRIVSSRLLAPDVEGYAGAVPVLVRFDLDENIVSVVPTENDESPAYFNLLLEEGLLESWNGMSAAKAVSAEVDAVSGATFSSKALIENVRAAAATRIPRKTE